MGEEEISYLLESGLIEEEHATAVADDSVTFSGSHGLGNTTYLLFTTIGVNDDDNPYAKYDDLIVAAYPQAEPDAWIPGEGGPTWDDIKADVGGS